jgi:hypothetical protein
MPRAALLFQRAVLASILKNASAAHGILIGVAGAECIVAFLLLTKAWEFGTRLLILFMALSLAFTAVARWIGYHAADCGCFGALRLSDAAHWCLILGSTALAMSALLRHDLRSRGGDPTAMAGHPTA